MSAAVMLGISTAVVPIVNPVQVLPVASAQTYPETVVSGRTTFNVEQNPAGQYILVSPSPNIEGDQASDVPPVYLWPSLDNPDVNVEYPMQLVKKTVGGLDYYAWYVVRQNAYHESGEGDAVCQTMEWTARAVNDHQLWDPPNNGFLNEPRTTDRHFVNTSVQHFGSVWRFPFATGQPLFNYEMTFTFPGELPEPVREFNPLFTGAMDLTMQDGSTLHIPEFNPNPAHPGMPARRGYNVQQLEEQFGVNYFEWDIVKIGPANPGDDYVYKVSTPYIPAGSATVLQFNQSVPGAVANTETFETRVAATGEAFCYTPIEVQQGAEAEMASPTAFSSDTDAIADATYSRTPETPLWAVVREDGTIVVKPGYDIPAQEYAFPVNIHRAGDVQDTTVIAKVMVTPAQFQPTYTGTSVAQGATATTPTPVGADGLSLPRGTSYALDADNTENPLPAWATSIDPTTGVITVAPGFDVAPGIYQVPVTVTYPDGATGTVLAPVTVVNPNNPFYEPIQVVQGGDTPVIAAAPTNGDGSTLPTGTSFAATPETQDWATVNHDGTVSVPAGYDVPVGVYEVPVAVTYPDGTTSTIHLPVQVVNEDDPRYEPTMIEQGQAGTVKAPTDAQDGVLPEGARFALGDNPPAWATSINEATGEIEIAPGVTVPEGFYSIPVVVTIPGGTELTIEAPVAVTSTLKAPVYESITVNQSETGTVQIPRNHDGSALPTGTTFAAAPETQNWVTILPDGSISVIPGNTTPAGSYEVPVVVSYPDGTSETVSALVTVVNPNTPVYEQGSVLPGDSVTSAAPAGVVTEGAEYSIDPATVPAGWTNVTVDPATGVVTATAPGDAAAGVVAIPVTVTYADGSAVVVDFPVMVLPLAGEVDPFYTPVSTQPNVAVDVPVGLPEGQTVPEGTEFGLPEGYTPPAGWQVSVDAETGTVTVTPPADAPAGALIDVPVVATYPDGSTGELTATVTVGVTDAADNDPGYDPATVLPGAEVTVPQSGDSELPEGTEFGLPEGYTAPDGWTVEVDPGTGEVTATSPEGAVPGESITVPVVVSYPDGTTDDAPATIVVGDAGPTEADDNTPGYGAETTKPGTPVDVPQTGDTELPDGTEFTLPEDYTPPAGWEVTVDPTDGTVTVTPPADATPGTVIQVPIVVTYPDGSTDDATATVGVGTPDVLPTDADDNDPGYAPGKTDPGVALDVPQTGDTELPDGTEFTL
ncbi:Rib/alpha-like domain-containing protein, partial [Corynebacterium sp.]|uniref:Rib/alpha-like domain-containing protein n=1 Tax=Corynebacterium sp. TaxID=1720 RepID=UPI0026DEB924